jgi:MFS-type transporter involved in bile tolerance (Atg22 family)
MPYCPFPVQFMGLSILPISYVNILISMSVLFQAFFFIGFSGWGDFGSFRKIILLQTGIGGSFLCMANLFMKEGSDYGTAGVIFLLTNVLFGASIVMYNAYLPFLTKSHPSFQEKMTMFKEQKVRSGVRANGVRSEATKRCEYCAFSTRSGEE